MRAGRLDKYVTLQKIIPTVDDYGQPVEQRSTYAQVWARIRQLRGRELAEAAQITAELTAEILIRYRTDVLATDKVIFENVEYDIYHVAEVEQQNRRRGLALLCKARSREIAPHHVQVADSLSLSDSVSVVMS